MNCSKCDDEKIDGEQCQVIDCYGEYLPPLPEDDFLNSFF